MNPWSWLRSFFTVPESLHEQRLAAWYPEEYERRKQKRACDGPDTAHLRSVVGDRTDSDVPRPLSSRGDLPGAGNSVSGGVRHWLGCVKDDTSVPSQFASPIPEIQRAIECRALLDTAMDVSRAHPECLPVFIHSHQAGRDGQEIRN